MTRKIALCNRRTFLRWGGALALGLPRADSLFSQVASAAESLATQAGARSPGAKVAIVQCKTYSSEVKAALGKAFDLLGGIGGLVKNKTVAIKVNLTSTNFQEWLGRPVGETYMTHEATAFALVKLLFEAGAKRVRLLESTNSQASLEASLGLAGWDINALRAAGNVEFENTRNLGLGKCYAQLPVSGGYCFSSFALNHAYADTDVVVSLAKLKQHITAGVTLSMKNMFGITPNSLYGEDAGSEEAKGGRFPLHANGTPEDPKAFVKTQLPGAKPSLLANDPGFRIPRIVADLCAARPVHLALIDGISTVTGGEGWWCDAGKTKFVSPGVLIAGLNPVSTDAVATAVMGFPDPRAKRGMPPFEMCDNHILLAEQAGLGIADLSKIEVLGLPIQKAIYRFG